MRRPFFSRMTWCGALVLSLTLSILLLTVPVNHSAAQEQQRGTSRQLQQTDPVASWPSRTKRWALVIGVDQYRDGNISPLKGAANDAGSLARALTDYAGFPSDQVILLATDQPEVRQPTRINILTYLSNVASAVSKDGLLLVAFAGHGIERGGQAYLIPSDARLTDDVSLLEQSAVSVEWMHRRIRAAQLAQVIVLLDACRNDPSGRADAPNPLTDSYVRGFNFDVRNREVQAFATIYATAVGQRAYEYQEKKQGYFTWAVIEGLKGRAANERGEVTLAGLVRYVQDVVPKRIAIDLGASKQQRPFAVIEGYRADELLVTVSAPPNVTNSADNTTSKLGATLEDAGAVEAEYWEMIKKSTEATEFREYLKEYPQGRYVQLARLKLRQIEAAKSNRNNSDAGVSQPSGGNQPGSTTTDGTKAAPGVGTIVRNQMGMEFVYVPAGSFMMGSDRGVGEQPMHQVSFQQGFYIGRYEVTQAQWKLVMNNNPSRFKGNNYPVETVSWNDAQEFIRRLNARGDGFIYRLPSEAEWEYAARAGAATTYFWGDDANQACGYANVADQASKHNLKVKCRDEYVVTAPVGSFQPNAFGLYDVTGNVWEWCEDWYQENYSGASADGSAWLNGGEQKYRVLRGGSWDEGFVGVFRPVFRFRGTPDDRNSTYGLRLIAVIRT